MKLLERRVLIGLFAGVCALVFPAVAAASIHPTLALHPSGPAGATSQTLTYSVTFPSPNPPADSPASLTTHFPAGLLADSTIDGGKCLTQTAQDPNCQIASGTVALGPPVSSAVPAAEYLVAPPKSGDAAGVLLAVGGTAAGVADVTVRPSDAGLDVAFTNMPGPANGHPQIQAVNLVLSDLRLPSSCSAESMTVQTTSENGDSETSNAAPYQSTGCPSQSYAPQVTPKVIGLPNNGAEVIATITQSASEAASKSIELDLPSSLQPNLLADAGCLQGTPCQIGTASALTPLAPAIALANGTVTLGGSLTAPTITVAFPSPYPLSFTGNVNVGNNSVTVPSVPDVPITSLSLDIKNTPYGQAFTTTCQPGNLGAKFTGQGGQSSNVSTPIQFGGSCVASAPPTVGSPTASGSLTGLAAGKPVLKLHAVQGSNAPKISRVSITLGDGLSFSRSGLVKKCTGHGHHRQCKVVGKGLTLSGAKLKKIKIRGGVLVLTFRHAVSQVTITIRGPLLSESAKLHKKAKKHKNKKVPVTLKITDASGGRTVITLHLK